MKNLKKPAVFLDMGSIIIMGLTLFLFLLALFTKGLTHDILLEAGIFLISVKLINTTYVLHLATKQIEAKVDEIRELLKRD